MNQYLIAFCYLFTVILLFLAFLIYWAVPSGQPINIDLYRNNTVLSFAITDPSLVSYIVLQGETQEQEEVDNSWGNQEGWGNEVGWNHADDWTPAENQPHISTPEWIDWVFNYVNINQIREITGHLFAQNFRTQFEEANGYPFHTDTPYPSIPELKDSPVEEQQQNQSEINSNDEIPGLGNFENAQ